MCVFIYREHEFKVLYNKLNDFLEDINTYLNCEKIYVYKMFTQFKICVFFSIIYLLFSST